MHVHVHVCVCVCIKVSRIRYLAMASSIIPLVPISTPAWRIPQGRAKLPDPILALTKLKKVANSLCTYVCVCVRVCVHILGFQLPHHYCSTGKEHYLRITMLCDVQETKKKCQ